MLMWTMLSSLAAADAAIQLPDMLAEAALVPQPS